MKNKQNTIDLPEENRAPNLSFFFKMLWRRFGNLITLNLLMLPMVLPALAAFFIFFLGEKQPTANTAVYSAYWGLSQFDASPLFTFQWHINAGILNWPAFHSASLVWIAVLACFIILFWGWGHVGATYVTREIVRGNAVFVFSDFFHAVKKNFWSGLLLGIFDLGVIAVLIFDFLFFRTQTQGGSFVSFIFYGIICVLIVLYLIMRAYLYPMFITFSLSFKKLLKNALIFTTLGIKRNVMMMLGTAVLTGINVALIVLLLPIGVAGGLVLPFIHYMGICWFIVIYCTFPVIQKYMIDPYQKKAVDKDNTVDA